MVDLEATKTEGADRPDIEHVYENATEEERKRAPEACSLGLSTTEEQQSES